MSTTAVNRDAARRSRLDRTNRSTLKTEDNFRLRVRLSMLLFLFSLPSSRNGRGTYGRCCSRVEVRICNDTCAINDSRHKIIMLKQYIQAGDRGRYRHRRDAASCRNMRLSGNDRVRRSFCGCCCVRSASIRVNPRQE